MLAYREHAAQTRGVTAPNVVETETAHPAFDKAMHLFGVELRRAPVDPVTTQVDVESVAPNIEREHDRHHRLGLQLRVGQARSTPSPNSRRWR